VPKPNVMKKQFLILIVCLTVIGSTTVSCNSCDDKNTDPVPTGRPEVSNAATGDAASTANGTAGTNNSTNQGTASNGSISDNEGSTAGSPSTMSTSTNKSRDVRSQKQNSDRNGYSAPNGT